MTTEHGWDANGSPVSGEEAADAPAVVQKVARKAKTRKPSALADLPQPAPPNVPMAWAAGMFAALCERIDAAQDITPALIEAFEDQRLTLAEAVDRRIVVDKLFKGAVAQAKATRDEWTKRYGELEAAHERFKERTKEVVASRPDIPFEGTIGRIAIQRNSSAKLVFTDPNTRPQDVPGRFTRVTVTEEIDEAAIRAALEAGEELTFARLETGTHVRFRA
jgi:hypothetical protein